MQRRAEFRPFSWLNDLWKRQQLDLNPPYQRRSVWPDRYKSDFVTTALLNYPCPAIFLYEEIRPDGSFIYKVVDGKQRLTTLFDFVGDRIPVASDFPTMSLRERIFSDLDNSQKLDIWRYAFAIEFIPQENDTIINDIFNRINKNVAKLTPQELRHALFSGKFIQACETLAENFANKLPDFPRIAPQSRRQMKDVENVATLLLYIEQGERSLSQLDLDRAFSERDEEWDEEAETTSTLNNAIDYLSNIVSAQDGSVIAGSRLRNQADFYSLVAAIIQLNRENDLPDPELANRRLIDFVQALRDAESGGEGSHEDISYLSAARSASNDAGPRQVRISRIKSVLQGK